MQKVQGTVLAGVTGCPVRLSPPASAPVDLMAFRKRQVYAAGLYLDGSIMSSLKKFSAIPAAALTKTQAFFDVITSARQAKTMLLRFHRSVGAPAVIEVTEPPLPRGAPAMVMCPSTASSRLVTQLNEFIKFSGMRLLDKQCHSDQSALFSVRMRFVEMVLQALRDALKPKVDAKGVSKFESALSNVLGETVPKDSQLFLTCKADSVYISTSESTGSHVNAKGLCPALFGVYLGKSPISPAIKSGVATGFTKLE